MYIKTPWAFSVQQGFFGKYRMVKQIQWQKLISEKDRPVKRFILGYTVCIYRKQNAGCCRFACSLWRRHLTVCLYLMSAKVPSCHEAGCAHEAWWSTLACNLLRRCTSNVWCWHDNHWVSLPIDCHWGWSPAAGTGGHAQSPPWAEWWLVTQTSQTGTGLGSWWTQTRPVLPCPLQSQRPVIKKARLNKQNFARFLFSKLHLSQFPAKLFVS